MAANPLFEESDTSYRASYLFVRLTWDGLEWTSRDVLLEHPRLCDQRGQRGYYGMSDEDMDDLDLRIDEHNFGSRDFWD